MNDNEPRRIVTRTGTPVSVGPRVSQWAYSLQPYATRGVHLQVRSERGSVQIEAVDARTGDLLVAAPQIVALRRAMDPVMARIPLPRAA